MNPELRFDPITHRPVLIAPGRAARVGGMLARADLPDDSDICPFCEGREDRTPPEHLAIRHTFRSNEPRWQVRVVPNEYPAVFESTGRHEVIIECPQHEYSLAKTTANQLRLVLLAIRHRMTTRQAEDLWAYAHWFKNHGLNAGASLSHAHSQLVFLPRIPPNNAEELAAMKADRCPFCDLIDAELADGSRIVRVADQFVAFTARAGRFPYETWLFPRQHQSMFDDVEELGTELHWLLNRLDQNLEAPAYNMVLHRGPFSGEDFHWHFELMPRLTGIAGFEIGTGIFINPVLPEYAAEKLRDETMPH